MPRRFVFLAMFVCSAVAASAQVQEQITVEAVDVPVYVYSQGKPVRDLTKDDFELYVNRKRQVIDYFEIVDFAESAAASPEEAPSAASHAELRERRLFLLLFDLIFKHPNFVPYASALNRSRRAAVDMVDHALPTDLFAVAAITGGGVKFVSPFLRDHDAVRRAILQLAPSKTHDELGLSITASEREMADAWGSASLPDLLGAAKALAADREAYLAKERIESYAKVADRLRGLEGFKHVILFSDGYPFDPARQGSSVKGMAAAFQSANAYLHTVDLTPMATGSDPAVMSPPDVSALERPTVNHEAFAIPGVDWFAPQRSVIPPSENESLYVMSNATGGSWVHWTAGRMAPALQNLSASYSAVYRIGFKPSDARKGHNDIDVKVKNLPRGATVSFRRGFSATVAAKAAAVTDPLLLADIIQNDVPQSGTPPEVAVAGRRIEVLVPIRSLSRQLGALNAVQVLLYVFDSKGVPVLAKQKAFTLKGRGTTDRVIQQKLDLAPGSYVAKVLLRTNDSLAFVKKPFAIGPDGPSE
ncbi:MAG TPA: VWA domain-containing protein [Thermoanaerobaculia bacterium]|nr:VWA domain-containing protein [Thermoanaerobaculia bacterium]